MCADSGTGFGLGLGMDHVMGFRSGYRFGCCVLVAHGWDARIVRLAPKGGMLRGLEFGLWVWHPPGRAVLRPARLYCTWLLYTVPDPAALHLTGLYCIWLGYTSPGQAAHPAGLYCIWPGYTAPGCIAPGRVVMHTDGLSYTAPGRAVLHQGVP